MFRNDDIAEVREVAERAIAAYLTSPRQVADIRRLAHRVAIEAAKKAFPMGFAEGLAAAREQA